MPLSAFCVWHACPLIAPCRTKMMNTRLLQKIGSAGLRPPVMWPVVIMSKNNDYNAGKVAEAAPGRHQMAGCERAGSWLSSFSLSSSARLLEVMTSQTPQKTSSTANAWEALKTLSPIRADTMTETIGCT